MIYGDGEYRFQSVDNWGRGPDGHVPGGQVVGVAVDSRDRLYAFVRGVPAVQVYDRGGRYLFGWGAEDIFPTPHGIWVSPEDTVYLTDRSDHTVRKFTSEGEQIDVMGVPGIPGSDDTHFNDPNDVVITPSGEMYVADNGNYRVMKFSADGKLLLTWGDQGEGPGKFSYVHNVRVDSQGRVLVADRESSRVQIFDGDGKYLTEWKLPKPNCIFMGPDGLIYVTEEEKRKVNLFREDGTCLSRWGKVGKEPGQFRGFNHCVCADSSLDLYVCEIHQPDRLQKFKRL